MAKLHIGKKTLAGHIKSLFNGMGYILTVRSTETSTVKSHYLAVLQGQKREKSSEELAAQLCRGVDSRVLISMGTLAVTGIVLIPVSQLAAFPLLLYTIGMGLGYLYKYDTERGLEKTLSNIQKKAKRQHERLLKHHKKRGRELLLTNKF